MRKITFLLILVGFALPAIASKKITVEQLQQIVSAANVRPDAEIARQLSEMELTERLSQTALARMQASVLGENARQALVALADASAFLDPPVAEIPSRPAPDVAEQRRMLALTVAYVSKTIPQLPNFFATRETVRYEDTPQLQEDNFFVPYQPVHRVGATSVTVLYRDGQEAVDTGASKKPPAMTEGLTTKGVFGPILATVLLDAAQSKLAWSRWEQGTAGTLAVFSYAVPKEKSHYDVNYCCVASQAATNVANMHLVRSIAGYRGDMAIDPATGTILRLRVEADLKPTDPIVKAGILVEYGPVEIGGKTYICPVKSISTALAQTVQMDPKYHFPLANQLQPLQASITDTAFAQYHVFRAETRILTADAEEKGQTPAALSDGNSITSAAAAPPSEDAKPNAAASTAAGISAPPPSAPVAVAAPSSAPETASEAAPTPSPEPSVPEIGVTEATTVPDAPSNPRPTGAETGFTLHTTARLVDVGAVAYDKKGRAITDLKREDFEIYDNGRKQEIRYFGQAGQTPLPQSAPQQQTASADGQPIYTNRPAAESAGQAGTSATGSRATILLIDAANLAWGDLSYARQEIQRFLKTLPAGEPAALYTLGTSGFQVLAEPTPDHALIADKLAHWMPTAQDLANAQDEEERNRQHIDWVVHSSDLAFVNGNDLTDPGPGIAKMPQHGVDPELRDMGSNPQRDVLLRLEVIAHHLGLYPGHKSLAWISSDNVLVDWSSQAATREEKGSNQVDPLSLLARESLNEAHVSLYPVDVSQLEAGVITADLEHRLVEAKMPSIADPPAPPPNPTGRYAAEMHQDTRPIQGAFRDLAAATGGRALRRSGDIAGELNGIAADGRAAYLLSFTPDGPADGQYHLITLKLANRRDITLRYRTGYQYEKEPATLKERFQRAIWQPRDLNEIGLSATLTAAPKPATLKLTIAATDLGLADRAGLWSDKLDIFVVQKDDAGLHAQVNGQTLGLRLKPATYQRLLRDGVPFEVRVETHQGTGSVRIVVVDENAGRIGSVTIPAADLGAKP